MDDVKVFIEITYDDKSADVTLVLFRDRSPLPVSSQVKMLSLDPGNPLAEDWDGVKEVLVGIVESL